MPNPRFEQVISALNLTETREAWRCYWPADDAQTSIIDTWIFTPGRLDEVCAWLKIPAPAADALRAALKSTLETVERRALLAQAIRIWSTAHAQPAWMQPIACDEPWAALFQALLILGCMPETRRRHQLRGIPEQVTRETFNDVARWMLAYHETHGKWGFRSANWIFNHVSGRLFELGRLQFGRYISDLPCHVFAGRGPEARRVIALANDGLRVRPDGQFLTADRGIDAAGAHFVTRLDVTEKTAVGNAVNQQGFIEPAPTTLPLEHWQRVMEPGTPILDVHIPAGGPLDHAACTESFRWAAVFFPRYFPEHAFAGYTCTSWLIDPQLAQRLPSGANTVKFLRRFHWVPCASGSDAQTFERVFGGPVEIKTAPRDNTMKRAILTHVEAGGRWRHASGFVLRNEVAV